MTSMTEETTTAVDYGVENHQRFISTDAFKDTLWSVTVSQAHLHSVSVPPVLHALQKLGIEQPQPRFGSIVGRRDRETLDRLPVGSILRSVGGGHRYYYGINSFHEIERLVSPNNTSRDANILQVYSMGNGQNEGRGLGSAEDAAALRGLTEEVRQIGAAAKAAQRWCPAYDMTVAYLGVLEDCDIPEPITALEVADLPEGTILRSPFPTIRPSIYRRDDNSTNPSRTVRVIGRAEGHWEATMQVAAQQDERPEVLGMWEVANANTGAAFDDSGTIWRRSEEGPWVYLDGYDGVDGTALNLMRARWSL